MRNLEVIENDLVAAREALSSVEGTPAEVYSRIVGYYRSVRNWNLGKRGEYGERKLYKINSETMSPPETLFPNEELAAVSSQPFPVGKNYSGENNFPAEKTVSTEQAVPVSQTLLLLFVRASCPNCSPAKDAADRLGIPVHLLNADTEEGKAEARRRRVLSTPTAILLSSCGEEIARAINAETIGRLLAANATV